MNNNTKRNSSVSNFFYQFIYQLIIIVIPLIIASYLTRHLKETAIGEYTYSYTYAYYFVILAMLGITRYGQRVISERRSDEIQLRKTFWSLFFIHGIFSILITFFFFICCIFIFKDKLYYIQIIYVCSSIFDITWLFYGLEDFKTVVIKNLLIKIVEIILTLFLVKTPNDIYIYALIRSSSILAGMLILLPSAICKIKPIKFSKYDIKEHIKPLLVLSIAVIASTLYTMFDKTLLGLLSTKENVAFYEYSEKIISIPRTFAIVISTVLYPKACSNSQNIEKNGTSSFFTIAILYVFYISFGSIFGFLSIGDLIAKELYGINFAPCGKIMMAMSPLILIVSFGEILRTQILIPLHNDNKYIFSLVLSAVINIIISSIFIKIIGVYGAVLGTIVAEFFGLIYQICVCKKYFSIKKVLLKSIPFLISSITMMIAIIAMSTLFSDSIVKLILLIVVGFLIYTTLLLIYFVKFSKYKSPIINFLNTKIFQKKFIFSIKEKDKSKRNISIDILRIIGILLIVLAHTSVRYTNELIMNIRCFDVVMMVFISALSYINSSIKIETWGDYVNYIKRRFKRLIIPTWIFITIYFIFTIIMKIWIPNDIFNLKNIVLSYSLISGIGYVWIVRILFCMALIAPFIEGIIEKIKHNIIGYIIVALLISINEIIISFTINLTGVYTILVNTILIPILGYGIIYFVALLYNKIKNIFLKILMAFTFLCGTVIYIFKLGFNINSYKYPPQILYICYGLIVSIIMYEIFNIIFKRIKRISIIENISKQTFTFYFCHVFIVFFFENLEFKINWIIEYVIIILFSSLLTMLIHLVKKHKILLRGNSK